MKESGHSLRDLWKTIECTKAQIIGVPEGKRKRERVFEEITAENSPDLMKAMNMNFKKLNSK